MGFFHGGFHQGRNVSPFFVQIPSSRRQADTVLFPDKKHNAQHQFHGGYAFADSRLSQTKIACRFCKGIALNDF
jgi:hypothetical protein